MINVFFFISLLLLVVFQEVKILLFATETLSKGVTFGPVSAAWENETGAAVAGMWVSAFAAGQERSSHEFTRQDQISIATYLYILCLLCCNIRCLGY